MPAELDPYAQAVLEVIARAGEPHLATLTVPQARERIRAALVSNRAPRPIHAVEDLTVPTPAVRLALRLYRPGPDRRPVALFMHGGGWTVNDLDTHDDLCRAIAVRSGWTLASLEYRKAPEHPHPAPLHDTYVTYRWLLDSAGEHGCTPAPPALVGESSGATIASNLSVLLRDLGAPTPPYQVLAYPATDRFDRWPSYRERGEGYILDRRLMEWYYGHCLPAGAREPPPYFVPLDVEDLSGLPPTLILTAEFDPLRDEGREYARRLAAAGVPVEHVHAARQMHGFLLLGRVVPEAARLVDRVGDALAARAPSPISRRR